MDDFLIYTLQDEPLSSPPRSLLPLMLTCRHFYNVLHPHNNPHLYRHIFSHKFDITALTRRLTPSSTVPSLFFPELKKRLQALRCIKRGDIYHPDLQDALLVAYIMVLEDDDLNYRQLQEVDLPTLLNRYINERLHPGHNVWPKEDPCNVLAVALFWHMTSQDALDGESNDSRVRVMDTLMPLWFAWFRYSFAEQGFDPHVFVNGSSSSPRLSPHMHPPVPPAPVTIPIKYMTHAFHLRLPAIALSASLAYFARLDAFPLAIPAYLPSTRVQGPIDGPTVEDIEEYNRCFRTRPVPHGPGSPGGLSTRHDLDWLRAIVEDPVTSGSFQRYTPGTLTGKWRGTALASYDRDFTPFMTGDAGPAALPGHSRLPFFCCLEEHVRFSKPKSCPFGDEWDEWDDPSNIPLLPPTTWTRKENGMELLFDERSSSTKVLYQTFKCERHGEEPENVQRDSESGSRSSTKGDDEEIVDVILTGKTEAHLQPAWGNFVFSGRVRISDGLVVLIRQPLNAHGGRLPRRTIYAGYVLSSQNFVGKWKYCSPGAQWEGIWTLCKTE
ncbi:hypothetical protein B0F90DRAFT_1669257 [Multifurca ochricompacta]|uniref:F-box domain-containing protein n=1 Tax=Multifurca ochricompacta TaxID=376703 RepID=A0AAD4M1K7_9AGAM|nr:hypothetical protein B0F90DRAFT_1669257 [Multifurca ochricompacta]